ncbi:MAG: hypothetical protein ACI8QC_000552 [Planctomycetota bacterium]|jgi:hypothetical protein
MSKSFITRLVRSFRRRFTRSSTNPVLIQVDSLDLSSIDNLDPEMKFSKAWFERLYAELGNGISCYRPPEEKNYSGGMLDGCGCCPPSVRLHLLPNEESGFIDQINDTDFQIEDHPIFENRKSIVCNKLGNCNGRKPYTCRTHPVHFVKGLMLYEEAQCRLGATLFFQIHKDAVEHVRSVVYQYELEDVPLGYGHGFRMKDSLLYREFEH